MNSPKNICLNCGKQGHQHKACDEPIISYGIISFTFCHELNINSKLIENFFYNKFLDIEEFNYTQLDNIKLIPHFYDKIKILMVRRKNSLNYLEFIRGKYDLDNKKQISKMLRLMSVEENLKIKNTNFDDLWNELWKETAKSKIYQREFNLSKIKFEELKENNFYDFLEDHNLSIYDEPEWGFPKGRRNSNEKNLNCALREFTEETNISLNHLHILERLNCVDEEYTGSNDIKYKHIYYLASTNNEMKSDIDNDKLLDEIGDIKWFTIPEAISKIRPYYEKRIKMIHQIYFFLINLIVNITTSNKKLIIE